MCYAPGNKPMTSRLTILTLSLYTGACLSAARPLQRQECIEPDARLSQLLPQYELLRATGCTAECGNLRREIERLVVVCPTHAPTLMANAVLAYDDKQVAAAQQLLDILLGQSGSHADAAALRARIALEEGNVPFALRLLQDRIKLAPDHAGLREAYGAALYLSRQYAAATRELNAAGAFGAPSWRVAYHLGLIDEAEGRLEAAAKRYAEALAGNAGWAPAQSRLTALRATGK